MIAAIAALSAGGAIVFAALAIRRHATVESPEARLSALRAEVESAASAGAVHADGSSPASIAKTGSGGIARTVLSAIPRSSRGRLDEGLAAAGHPITASAFVLFTLTLGIVGILVMLAMSTSGGSAPATVALMTIGGGLFGFALMPIWLRNRIRARRLAIWRSLPDAADLLTTCVEAGLGVDAAIARVASELQGPLQTELRAGLQEISLGRPRRDAFEAVGRRVGVEDLSGMLAAIIESEETGTSLGRVLRAQARHVRARRKLYAEERARKVPAKMTFPIVFLIVPTLFILILGPLAAEVSFLFD